LFEVFYCVIATTRRKAQKKSRAGKRNSHWNKKQRKKGRNGIALAVKRQTLKPPKGKSRYIVAEHGHERLVAVHTV